MGHVSNSCLARAEANTLFLQALQTTGRIAQVVACGCLRAVRDVSYGQDARVCVG